MEEKIAKYTADIEKYSDVKINKKLVTKLAQRLASTMAKKDSSAVACGDEKELETVRRNFIKAKLGVDSLEKGRSAMEAVCLIMKKSRNKSRITFYYLLAVELKKATAYLKD